MQGQSKFEQFLAHQKVFLDKDIKINISFSEKQGVTLSEIEKSSLTARNHSIKTMLEQRQYILDQYIVTKNEELLEFVNLCNEQLLKILGIPILAVSTSQFPLEPIGDLKLQLQDLESYEKARLIALKIPSSHFDAIKATVVPTVNANTNEC